MTEAQAAARLDHPFVCKIYEVAEDPPTDASALVNPASSYAGLNQHTGAVEAYEKAFALDPELRTGVFVNHEYGFALVHLGQFDRAAAVSC